MIKAALKLCMHVSICYIWVKFKNMSLKCSGFQNCPGAHQHCLPNLTHPIQIVSLLEETLRAELWEITMHVRSLSCSRGKIITQLLWCLLIKVQKKKEEINNFCSFKDSFIFNFEFSVW